MPSTPKPARNPPVTVPRRSDYTKAFTKDWTALTHSGRYNMGRLKEVMLLLIANAEPLGAEWADHDLSGDWSGHRECHVGGDFLLIYTIAKKGSQETVVFDRVGTHSQLFA